MLDERFNFIRNELTIDDHRRLDTGGCASIPTREGVRAGETHASVIFLSALKFPRNGESVRETSEKALSLCPFRDSPPPIYLLTLSR